MLKESITAKPVAASTSSRLATSRPGSSMGSAARTAEPKPAVNRLAKPAPATSRLNKPIVDAPKTDGSTSARATKPAFGIKRPSTAMTTNKSDTNSVGGVGASRLAAPSSVTKSTLKAPSTVSHIKSKLESNVTSRMGTAASTSTASRPTSSIGAPRRSIVPGATGPKSAEQDLVDDIYKEQDPIDTSLGKRKKAGALASVVPDKNAKSGKFFFQLRLKGDGPVMSE